MWTREFETVTSADRNTLWALWADVDGWTRWNPGLDEARLWGRFESGAEFSMTPAGQPTMKSRLLDVQPGVAFTDETVLGDICVRVTHRLEPLPGGQLRIVYGASVTGPGEAEVGEAITGDFQEVLASLVRCAMEAEGVAPALVA